MGRVPLGEILWPPFTIGSLTVPGAAQVSDWLINVPNLAAKRAIYIGLGLGGGVLCRIAYFFFSTRHSGAFGWLTRVGIWVLMIGFGATFGFTVMGRVSLLLGRVNFIVAWVGMLFGGPAPTL